VSGSGLTAASATSPWRLPLVTLPR
jgi:hypothetical protein